MKGDETNGGLPRGIFHGRRVDKPWGYELIWGQTQDYVGKILHIEAGGTLSLQYHRVKDETMYLLSGEVELLLGDHEDAMELHVLVPGQSAHLPPGRRHRLRARVASDVLEVSTPQLDDVVRLLDDYGRAGTTDV